MRIKGKKEKVRHFFSLFYCSLQTEAALRASCLAGSAVCLHPRRKDFIGCRGQRRPASAAPAPAAAAAPAPTAAASERAREEKRSRLACQFHMEGEELWKG